MVLGLLLGNKLTMEEIKVESGWCTIRVEGPLDFSLIGILSKLATTLAEVSVSIFVISTFDTDYLLIKKEQLDTARDALKKAGHTVFEAPPKSTSTKSPTTESTATESSTTTTTTNITIDTTEVAGFAPFALERYFAKHEFSAPYLLCCSDVEPLLQKELLEMADDECKQLAPPSIVGIYVQHLYITEVIEFLQKKSIKMIEN